MVDVTRGVYMFSRTFCVLRMIGSSAFASYGLIAMTMLSFPDPLVSIQLTGRRYSVRPMPLEPRTVVIKSLVASGEGDHSVVDSKASAIPVGFRSSGMRAKARGRSPVLINVRISRQRICFAGWTLGGRTT